MRNLLLPLLFLLASFANAQIGTDGNDGEFYIMPSLCRNGCTLDENQGRLQVGQITSLLVTWPVARFGTSPTVLLFAGVPNGTVLGGLPSPFDVGLLWPQTWPLPGCYLWADSIPVAAVQPQPMPGFTALRFTVPNIPALFDQWFIFQAFLADPVNVPGWAPTNGLLTVIE